MNHFASVATLAVSSNSLQGISTMEQAISLTATAAQMAEILKLAQNAEGVEGVSEPAALDGSRALNAGLTPEDLRAGLEVATLIFKAGGALFVFLKAVRDYLKTNGGAVGVSDGTGSKPLGRIDATSRDETLSRLLPP